MLRCRKAVRQSTAGPLWRALVLLLPIVIVLSIPAARAAEPAEPAAAATMRDMGSAGWLEGVIVKLETEARSDISMLPDTTAALEREWRSFDRNGSALGALGKLGWVVLLAALACVLERGIALGLCRRVRRAMRLQPEGPRLSQLLRLILADAVGVAALAGIFVYGRHWLLGLGVAVPLIVIAANVLVRWRIGMLIIRIVLRPSDPPARLVEGSDDRVRGLFRFLSTMLLAVMVLIAFGRYVLADEDSGAPHVIGLLVAAAVGVLNAAMVYRARWAGEALIRGPRRDGILAAVRDALARAWLPVGLATVLGLMVLFVFGLSLGLLSYYHAIVSSLGVLLVLVVLDRVSERGWRASTAIGGQAAGIAVARSGHRILRAIILLIGTVTLAWLWIEAIELSPTETDRLVNSSIATMAIVFAAYMLWEGLRLAIDRHVQPLSIGPRLPGAEDDTEGAPGSRLQTVLPMLRAGFAVVIALLTALVVLSRLGVDTAPLIAGAGVFGLAISFGSQSLVRDIISGLFYMWDDAFRVGEYIDTGRLRGTVETLGIRSVKVRHHNGPLHTIPYGQLGAVTNLSRDFATIKFNLRLEPGSDIELVRKTAKQIGLAMQDNPEIAAEVILPLKLQGLVEVADNALVLRFKFTARPLKPSWVQREYLKRIYRVFTEKGIAFASGAVMLQTIEAKAAPPDRSMPIGSGAPASAPVKLSEVEPALPPGALAGAAE